MIMRKKIKKIILVNVFCFLSITAKSESLKNISGILKLENFSKIKNIEAEKILDYDTQIVLNNNLACEKENDKLFTGIAIQKIKDNIKNINFYENGNLISYYKYFLDGNIEEAKEIDKEKNQVITQKYNKNKKNISQRIYENGFLKSENQYVNRKLTLEYRANGKENGNFIYYDGNKKVLSEIKDGEIKIKKQIREDFSKNLAASKDIYDNKPGIEFLKSIGKGIGNVFLMIIDGVFGTDMYRSLNY